MKTKICFYCIVMSGLIVAASPLFGQAIVINWTNRSVESAPAAIHKSDKVNVTVKEVNNILYDYTVDVSLQVQSSGDDLALLGGFLGASPAAGGQLKAIDPCGDSINDAEELLRKFSAFASDPKNRLSPSVADGKEIPLQDTLNGWSQNIKGSLPQLDNLVAQINETCPGARSKSFMNGAYGRFDKFRKKVEGSHVAEGQSAASPGEVSAVAVNVIASFTDANGQKQIVSTYSKTLTFSPVLTLSGGVLLSTLRHPTYIRQPVPGSSDPVLAIDKGAQPVPNIVALLNYKIPHLDWPWGGLALSTGPVLRVGGDSSNSSSFGYFNGVSVNLWHRLFVTAGSHVGQFADIPIGFKIFQTVPASFVQLTPTDRWSARFAVAITYKTNDFGALTSQTKTKDRTKTTGK